MTSAAKMAFVESRSSKNAVKYQNVKTVRKRRPVKISLRK